MLRLGDCLPGLARSSVEVMLTAVELKEVPSKLPLGDLSFEALVTLFGTEGCFLEGTEEMGCGRASKEGEEEVTGREARSSSDELMFLAPSLALRETYP